MIEQKSSPSGREEKCIDTAPLATLGKSSAGNAPGGTVNVLGANAKGERNESLPGASTRELVESIRHAIDLLNGTIEKNARYITNQIEDELRKIQYHLEGSLMSGHLALTLTTESSTLKSWETVLKEDLLKESKRADENQERCERYERSMKDSLVILDRNGTYRERSAIECLSEALNPSGEGER